MSDEPDTRPSRGQIRRENVDFPQGNQTRLRCCMDVLISYYSQVLRQHLSYYCVRHLNNSLSSASKCWAAAQPPKELAAYICLLIRYTYKGVCRGLMNWVIGSLVNNPKQAKRNELDHRTTFRNVLLLQHTFTHIYTWQLLNHSLM